MISENDAKKLAMASIFIALILNIAVTGYRLAGQTDIYATNLEYGSGIVSGLTNPTLIYCQDNDQTCTNTLANVPSEDTNQFDKLQSTTNWLAVMGTIFTFLGMTLVMPLYVGNVLVGSTTTGGGLISNPWLIGLVSIFLIAWQITIMWAMVKLVMRK